MGGATRRSRRPRVTQAVTGARFNGCSKKNLTDCKFILYMGKPPEVVFCSVIMV
uniref:Uncharacterized protein n=1 Tax=Anguilla anguilla TaxID=7936 RepID=A0A0E9PTT5_ANGAN